MQEDVKQIQDRATRIQEQLLEFASRAFVIEFAGTPKAGKSTSVEAIRHFFSRHNFRVHVLIERASVCPIPMKGHLFFNTWCAATMLAELLANVDTDTDLIIVDRGIFDALVWLTLQHRRDEVTDEEAKTIEDFLLLTRWRSLIDLAVVMNVSPAEAISRENSQRITPKVGSIMNPEVLENISSAVEEAIKKYSPKFSAVIEHATSGSDVKKSNVDLASKILSQLERALNPDILVISKEDASRLPLSDGGAFDEASKLALQECLSKQGRFVPRLEAENNDDVVQIISCGLLMHEKQVFLFERPERDPKFTLYGKTTIWQGTHVQRVDGIEGLELLRVSLADRVRRSLFLSRTFAQDLIGYCWEGAQSRGRKHLGVMFRVEIENDHTASDLKKKEFRHGRGHGLKGRFVSWPELRKAQADLDLEAWSKAVLAGYSENDPQ